MRKKKFQSSPNLMEYAVFYKDRELPAIGNSKVKELRQTILQESIQEIDHPLNQLTVKNNVFVPYINERDTLGRLISQQKAQRAGKSFGSTQFLSARASQLFGSKNSISNTNSILENSVKMKLKNLLGNTSENSQEHTSSNMTLFQFNSKSPSVTLHRKQRIVQSKLEYPIISYKVDKTPKTPIALRLFKSNLVIEQFNKSQIQNVDMVMLFEKIFQFQRTILQGKTSKDRRMTYVKQNGKRIRLCLLLLISRSTQNLL